MLGARDRVDRRRGDRAGALGEFGARDLDLRAEAGHERGVLCAFPLIGELLVD